MAEQPKYKILNGNAHPQLAKQVARILGTKLTDCTVKKFSNSEVDVRINESIRNNDVFIIQSGSFDQKNSVNDYLMETLILIDACRRSNAKSIILIMPCYPYARQDKKDSPRVPISAKLVANLIYNAGVNRMVSVDLHAAQIQGFFDIAFDNLYAIKVLSKYIKLYVFNGLSNQEVQDKYILISPDNGGTKRIMAYSQKLKLNNVIMHKQRDYSTSSKVDKSILIGEYDLKGKTGIVIDDMVDTMGTMLKASEILLEHGIKDLIVVATHGILSGPALDRINKCEFIQRVIVTNSLPQEENEYKCAKLEVVNISNLIAMVIRNIATGESISELFE